MHFAIQQASEHASNAMRRNAHGKVVAVFSRSFYVELKPALICIGTSTLTNSPLNVISDAPSSVEWQTCGLQVGDPIETSPSHLSVAESLTFSWTEAEIWQPPDPPANWSRQSLSAGLGELDRLAATKLPDQGLGYNILSDQPDPGTRVADFAAHPIQHFQDWLQQSLTDPGFVSPEPLRRVVPLLGLGPGLTPSGDDFLGGAMIALHHLSQPAVARSIADLIREHGKRATTSISIAHLEAAAKGLGSELLHNAINGIMGGKHTITNDILMAVDQIGHCSGWDALAGAVIVLRIWLDIKASAKLHSLITSTKDPIGNQIGPVVERMLSEYWKK
ncbi:MAG: DUF2877 domain-containing protein [Rhodospirillales bacterium]|jgi:hypothetical protein